MTENCPAVSVCAPIEKLNSLNEATTRKTSVKDRVRRESIETQTLGMGKPSGFKTVPSMVALEESKVRFCVTVFPSGTSTFISSPFQKYPPPETVPPPPP